MRDKIKVSDSIESDHRETRNRRRKNIPTSVRCSQYRAPGFCPWWTRCSGVGERGEGGKQDSKMGETEVLTSTPQKLDSARNRRHFCRTCQRSTCLLKIAHAHTHPGTTYTYNIHVHVRTFPLRMHERCGHDKRNCACASSSVDRVGTPLRNSRQKSTVLYANGKVT